MGMPELLIPDAYESPALEGLGLGTDVESLGRARDFMERLACDALKRVHPLVCERIDAIEATREGPPLWVGGYSEVREGANPFYGELANRARAKGTHFKWLLAKGTGYSLYANVYGLPITSDTYEGGEGYLGTGQGVFVEREHTHNRHFVIMRTHGPAYRASERLIPEAQWTDRVITSDDEKVWTSHRASIAPGANEYGVGAVYAMYADSTHALSGIVEGSPSLSLALELDPVREFSTTFTADGSVDRHYLNGQRKMAALQLTLRQASE